MHERYQFIYVDADSFCAGDFPEGMPSGPVDLPLPEMGNLAEIAKVCTRHFLIINQDCWPHLSQLNPAVSLYCGSCCVHDTTLIFSCFACFCASCIAFDADIVGAVTIPAGSGGEADAPAGLHQKAAGHVQAGGGP